MSAPGCRHWFGQGASPDQPLLPLPEQRVPLRILYQDYGENLTQDNLIKVVALLTEQESGDVVVAVRDILIQNPEIKIRVRAQCLALGGLGGTIPLAWGCCHHPEGLAPAPGGAWAAGPCTPWDLAQLPRPGARVAV